MTGITDLCFFFMMFLMIIVFVCYVCVALNGLVRRVSAFADGLQPSLFFKKNVLSVLHF